MFTISEVHGGHYALGWASGWGIVRPSLSDVQALLMDFKNIIENILLRDGKSISFKRDTSAEDHLRWAPELKRFIEFSHSSREWVTFIYQNLKIFLIEYGHLINACHAHAPWGNDRPCGKWFVAGRPTQKYCSSQCRGRETVRSSRKGNVKKTRKASPKISARPRRKKK